MGVSQALRDGTRVRQIDAAAVPADRMARRGQVACSDFDGRAIARLAVDSTGLLVDPTPPASLIRCMTKDLGDGLGAARAMVPDLWTATSDPAQVPSLWMLEGAHVMGGTITKRTIEGHHGGQLLLTAGAEMIPASYGVMDGRGELAVDLLEQRPDGLALRNVPAPRELGGAFYFLGNVHRHFGHSIVEGLTRLWALEMLEPTLSAEIRFLVYEGQLASHSLEFLRLAGVPVDRIVHASPHDIVEKLIVPDVAMSTHRWITGFQQNIWQSVADRVPSGDPSRRVFLSRRNIAERQLQNEPEVEAYFEGIGYEIVAPEELSIEEQVRTARESVSLAGCVGSQMYLAAFQRPGAKNIVLAPRNFFLKDDVLISRATGSDLEVVLGSKVDFRKPKPERSWHVNLPSIEQAMRRIAPVGAFA